MGLEEEGFLFEEIENIVHNLSVEGGVVRSSDQDIVHVNEYHIGVLQFEGSEDAIHYALEGRGSIALTKQHNHRFEESKGRLERGFPLISVFDMDVVVPPPDIELREEAFPSEISC